MENQNSNKSRMKSRSKTTKDLKRRRDRSWNLWRQRSKENKREITPQPKITLKKSVTFGGDSKASFFHHDKTDVPGPGSYTLPPLGSTAVRINPPGRESSLKVLPGPGSFNSSYQLVRQRSISFSIGREKRGSPFIRKNSNTLVSPQYYSPYNPQQSNEVTISRFMKRRLQKINKPERQLKIQ